jgi:intracellular sulfur oxidation DsrE/DsrF family protein
MGESHSDLWVWFAGCNLKPGKGAPRLKARYTNMNTLKKPLQIDIPVKLSGLKIAFSIAALAFEGDLPASIFHLQLITQDVADWKANNEVIAVFHTNAGHVTLNDEAYNTERMVATGNPYKELIAGLVERGVRVELCGATAAVHHWGNTDLLPEIKVNTDAMARMAQLAQDGFVQIAEWD